MRTIYNTSFIINDEIEQEWVDFIRECYVAEVRRHKLSDDVIFTKVSVDQPEGKTYSLQLVFGNEEQKNQFTNYWLPDMESRIIHRFPNQYVCFSCILTEI